MSKKSNALGALFIVLLLSGGFAASSTSTSTSDDTQSSSGGSSAPDECSDLIDNDGDNLTDSDDPDCDPNNPTYDGTESGA